MSNDEITIYIKAKDQATQAFNNARKSVEGMGNGLKNSFASATAGSLAFAGGLTVVGAGIAGIATKAVKAFADYEQLIGGVETLFKENAGTVEAFANEAYKTAGMSANVYMETVTSFSASLLQGLGGDTKKAAEISNLAVTDMSDNANKMGTNIALIQNAYQGFAKDNFTMLDNLKLGYGGTAGEMARLVNDSGVLGTSFKATAENVKDIPFDQLISAINKTQTQLGITGTTALEASTTISGSFSSMKASWENLWASFASGNSETIAQKFNELKTSAQTFADNILAVLPKIAEGITGLVFSFVGLSPDKVKPFLDTLKDNLPVIAGAITGGLIPAVIALTGGIIGLMSPLLPFIALGAAIGFVVNLIVEKMGGWKNVIEAVKGTLQDVGNTLLTVANGFRDIYNAVKDNELVLAVVVGLLGALALVAVVAFGTWAIAAVTAAVTSGIAFVTAAIGAIIAWLPFILIGFAIAAIAFLIIRNWDTLKNALIVVVNAIKTAFSAFIDFVVAGFNFIKNIVTIVFNFIRSIIQGAANFIISIYTTLFNIIVAIFNGIRNIIGAVANFIISIYTRVFNVIIGIFNGIRNVITIVAGFIAQRISNVINNIIGGFRLFYNVASGVISSVGNFFSGLGSRAIGVFNSIKGAVAGAGDWIGSKIRGGVNSAIGAINSLINGMNKIPGVNIGNIPQYATGTNYHPGGMAIVGEQGPELVYLPTGSKVLTNNQTNQALNPSNNSSTSTGITNYFYGNFSFANAEAVNSFMEQMNLDYNKEERNLAI